MRRITLLTVLAVVLTAVMAIPAVAATTFAWSGEVTSDFQTNFTTAAEAVTTASVTLGVTINDNLSFSGLVIATGGLAPAATGALSNSNAAYYATMQLGNILGLDPKTLSIAVSIGDFGAGMTTYGVSGYANEALAGADMADGKVNIATTVGVMNLFKVYLAVDPASIFGTAAYMANVYGTFGPVNVSLAYGSTNQETLNASFSQAMGDLTLGVAVAENYDMGASTYNLGFGAKVAYKTLVTFGVGTTYGSAGLGTLDVNVNLAPAATWGADVWTIVDLANGGFTTSAGYLDLSLWTKLDASTLRVGYVYTAQTTAVGEYVAQTPGGLYFRYDLTF